MEKIYVKSKAEDIIRRARRDSGITSQVSIDLLDTLTDVIDAVNIEAQPVEKTGILQCILNYIASRREKVPPAESYSLDEEIMETAASKASGLLADSESGISELEKRNRELVRHLEQVRQENAQISAELDIIRKNIASHLQDLITDAGQDKITEEIRVLLKAFGMQAVWSSESTSPEMFNVLKVENLSRFREKPCLVHNGEIILRGTSFAAVNGTGERRETL